MQPPRPFQGAPYDKNMFTFLPAVANVESLKKRNLLASDRDITMPASTMGYGSSGNLYPKENAVDLGDRELPNCIQASLPGDFSTSRNYSNDFVAPCHPSESQGYSSFAGEGQSFRYKDSSLLFQPSVRPAHNLSNWNPLVTEEINQHGSDVSKAQVGGEEKGFDFPKCQTYGQQNPSLMKIEGSDPNAQTLEEPQNLQQYVSKSGTYVVDLDGKGCHEHSFKIETSSNTKGLGDSSSFANMLGNNVGTLSLHSLHEANNVIQQALRIVRASSGSGLTVNQDGISQACEGDPMKMNSTPNSLTQDLVRSLIETTSAPGGEAGLNVDKPVISVEKSSINVDDGPKIEEGDSALAEKLWDGTLQLSFSVSVSTIAFFKSGERLQDFSWPGSVEVKGKVKLEAFEKYVQDLPRSRTRGLMVMSLCAKEDSSGAGLKRMKEIAKRYRDGNRVGLAQSGSGVDMYICPHSDTIITILARHGFFKGNIAVTEKSDPLLGCVVWRKNSSAPATKTTVIDDPESGPSLSAPSSSGAKEIPSEKPEKTQTEAEIGKYSSGKKSPEVCLGPSLDQSEQSIIPENMITSVSDNNKQLSENNGNVETNLSLLPVLNQSAELCDDEDLPEYDFGAANSQISKSKPAVTAAVSPTPGMAQSRDSQDHRSTAAQMRADNSTVSGILSNLQLQGLQQLIQKQSEVQNRISQAQQEQQTAVSLTPEMVQYGDSQVHQAIAAQMRADSSSFSGILSDFQLQGLQKLIQKQSDAENRSTKAWQEQQRGDCTFSSRSSVQGAPQNLGNQPETMIPSQPIEGKRPLDECTATRKPNSLFDDDDMPEWQPPDFKKMRPEGNVMAGPPFALSNSIRPGPSFTDLATGRQLPPPPPRPPLPRPPAFTPVQPHDRKFPTEHQLPLPPPPLPPLPPPSSQGQFFDNNYPPVPHLPKPPAHAFNLENPDAKTSMHNSSLPQSTPVQFQGNHYSPAGHLPPPPSLPPPPPLPPLVRTPFSDNDHSTAHHFPKPSANNFNHNGAAAPPTYERFPNQHFPPLPPLPPPVPDNTFANNFTYNDNTSTSPLARQAADKRVGDGSGHGVPPFPPGFTPNHGFRPKYQQHGRDNYTHPSAWRNSRP